MAIFDARRHEGQVHRIEMTVELERSTFTRAVQARHHRRCFRPTGVGSFHLETLCSQQLGQSIGHSSRITRGTGDIDEADRRVEEALLVDSRTETLGIGRLGRCHGHRCWHMKGPQAREHHDCRIEIRYFTVE
jgi:hypothetical protein